MTIEDMGRNARNIIPPLRMPKLIIGEGSINMIGEELKKLGMEKAIIIADREIIKLGLIKEAKRSLENNNINVDIFEEVKGEPNIDIIEKAVSKVQKDHFDIIIGIGGGSVMDTTKVVACVAKNGGNVRDYMENTKKIKERLPFILVPTTAGTGAEVSPASVVIDEKDNCKKIIAGDILFSDLSIVDSLLTFSLPPKLTAYTGVDALCHAMGCYISKKANPLTDAIAIEAIKLIGNNLRQAVSNGMDKEARYKMSLGTTLGMIARVNSGGGATHGLAYPLGTQYHIPHALSIALLMPYVMAFNVDSNIPKFIRIAEAMGERTTGLSENTAAYKAIEAITSLLKDINIPLGLKGFGVKKEDFSSFAEEVYQFSYRHIEANPVMLSKEDIVKIYENAF